MISSCIRFCSGAVAAAVAVVVVGTGGAANAAEIPVSITIPLNGDDIVRNGNDLWLSPWIPLDRDQIDPREFPLILVQGDAVIFDIDFVGNRRLRIEDLADENTLESIHFEIDGSRVGAGEVPGAASYQWEFTDKNGNVIDPPGQIRGLLSSGAELDGEGDADEARMLDILGPGTGLTFYDLRLRIHVPVSEPNRATQWRMDRLRVGVDAEHVTAVPEPPALVAFGLGLAFALPQWVRRHRLAKRQT